jgi:hypoxanthine phosphoribosyltransferase
VHHRIDRARLEVLYSAQEIAAQVNALAQRIVADYLPLQQREGEAFRLVLVGVLSGAEPFLSDLARALSGHFPAGCLEKEYVALSSYRQGTAPGAVRFLLDTKRPLTGAHALVVEDIVDTGKTLNHLVSMLRAHAPRSFRVCALIDKPAAREKQPQLDYVGFRTDGELWLVGYGLDYDAKGRELPDICSMHFPE